MTPKTLLLRQIHPNFINDGEPTSQAFQPTPKDEALLSVDNADRIDARQAHERFTGISIGVRAVSCAECSELTLPIIEDATPYPEHCSIDFSELSNSAIRNKARLLRAYAAARGWLYVAPIR